MSEDNKTETAEQVIRRAEETLETARHGFEDFTSKKGPRRFSGLRNLVVFGRSVTFVLQNLRGVVEDFDDWYEPQQEQMKADFAMRYFVELRNQILKQGRMSTGFNVTASFSTSDLEKLGPKPPGTKGFFIGDQYGGSGWVVELPDGSEEKYYVELPTSIADVKQVFADVPEKYKAEIEGHAIEDLAAAYLSCLEELLDSCRKRFLGAPAEKAGGKRLPPYLRVVK